MAARRTALVGRSKELDLLDDLLDQVRRGKGSAAVLSGAPGIGKTRLLTSLLDRAANHGFQVWSATATEMHSDLPFAVIHEALGDAPPTDDREPVGDLVELRRDLPQLQFRVVEEAAGRILEATGRVPCVLAIDNVHWIDPGSALLLTKVLQRVAARPLLIAATTRPLPRARGVEEVMSAARDAGALALDLQPLEPDDVKRFIELVLGSPPGPRLLDRVAAAGGNPLFLGELLEAMRGDGSLVFGEESVDIEVSAVPASLPLTILTRLSFLSLPALELMRVASIVGSSMTMSELCAAANRSALELLPMVDEAVKAGVLRDEEDHLLFNHEVVREAIYEDIPSAARQTLHREIGRALLEAGAPMLSVSRHLVISATPGDTESAGFLRGAALNALGRAPEVAIDLLERALDITPADESLRSELQTDLVFALVWGGRPREGEALARRLLLRVDPSNQIAVRVALSQALQLQARWPESIEQLLLCAEDEGVSARDRARYLGEAAQAQAFEGALQDGEELARAALDESRAAGDALGESLSLYTLGATAYMAGRLDSAIGLLEEAVGASASSAETMTFLPRYSYGMTLIHVDRLDDAQQELRAGLSASEAEGRVWDWPLYHYGLGLRHYYRAEWGDAVAELESGVRLAEDVETRWQLLFPLAMLGKIAIERDDLRHADEIFSRAQDVKTSIGEHWHWGLVLWMGGSLSEARGEKDRALALYEAAEDFVDQGGFLSHYRYLAVDLVRLSAEMGDRGLIDRAVAQMDEVDRRSKVASASACATLVHAIADDDHRLFVSAVEQYRSTPRRCDAAYAAELASASAFRRGDLSGARSLISEALDTYALEGATRRIASAERIEREVGIRRGKRGPRGRPSIGWEALTETELKVGHLVAEGARNAGIGDRLYISPRTVETHVSHILRKLQVSTRAEIATEFTRRAMIEGTSGAGPAGETGPATRRT